MSRVGYRICFGEVYSLISRWELGMGKVIEYRGKKSRSVWRG